MKKLLILLSCLLFGLGLYAQPPPLEIKPKIKAEEKAAAAKKPMPKKTTQSNWREKYQYVALFSEGLAEVKRNGKCGYVNKSGEEVIPLKYDYVFAFSEGLATVKLNGKWGFINTSGEEVIPLKYDEATYFTNGKAQVKLNGREFYIDKNGNEIK